MGFFEAIFLGLLRNTDWILLFAGLIVGLLWFYVMGSSEFVSRLILSNALIRRLLAKSAAANTSIGIPKSEEKKIKSFVESQLRAENSRLRAEVEALRAQVHELDQDLKGITASWRSKLFSEPVHKMNISEASAKILADLHQENPESTFQYQES